MRLCMFMYVYVNHVQSSAVDLLVLRVLFSKWLVEDHLKVLKLGLGVDFGAAIACMVLASNAHAWHIQKPSHPGFVQILGLRQVSSSLKTCWSILVGPFFKQKHHLVGGLEHLDDFSILYGMSSFPLTNSYVSRWLLHHQPVIHPGLLWKSLVQGPMFNPPR